MEHQEEIAEANDPAEAVARLDRREIVKMLLVGTVASILGVALVLAIDWFPDQRSTAAPKIDTLWDVTLVIGVPVFVLVMTVAIYSVVKFRAMPGDRRDGPPIHGSTKLEIAWVTIPFLIVSGLAVYSWVVLDQIEKAAPDEMVVDVTGQQFAWRFAYPGEGGLKSGELVLPVGRTIKFNIRSDDVIHSFWVPEFRMKQDAVAGLTTTTRVTPTRTGSWQIVCAELCGIGHSTMRQRVKVVDESEFETFVADLKAEDSERANASGGGGDAQ